MKRSLMLFVAVSALASSSAFAQADLAKAKNCMACHAVASKLVGPAYKDVAAKYLPALKAIKYEGVTGTIQFDQYGDIKDGALTLFTYKGGKRTKLDVIR